MSFPKKMWALIPILAGVAVFVDARSQVRGPTSPEAVSTAGAAHMVLQIDPDTGQFVQGVPDLELTPRLRQMTDRSHDGLEIVPSPVPNGGDMIDLGGRFMNLSTARVLDDGTLATHCSLDRVNHHSTPRGED